MHLGDALRWFRTRHGLNQVDAGLRMGLQPNSAQRLVSMRERPADHPDYVEASVTELLNLEDATGVPRGTILRHARYVDSAGDELPAELSPITLKGIRALVAADLEEQSIAPERPQRRAGRVRLRGAEV